MFCDGCVQPLRDYGSLRLTILLLEYLNSYYLTTNNPTGMDDQDVVLLRPQLEVRNHRLCRI
jgi:hypothetical protein